MGEYQMPFGKYQGLTMKDIADSNPWYVTWLSGAVNKFSLRKDSLLNYAWIKSNHPESISKAKEFVAGKCPNCLQDCKEGCKNSNPTRNYHYHPYGKR
jgi:hypothetical protein